MEIKVIDWIPDRFNQNPKIIGKVKVLLGGRMFVWMTVLKGKQRPFVKFPSIKLNDSFQPTIGWIEDDKKERKISDEVIAILKNRNDI